MYTDFEYNNLQLEIDNLKKAEATNKDETYSKLASLINWIDKIRVNNSLKKKELVFLKFFAEEIFKRWPELESYMQHSEDYNLLCE